MGKFKRIVALMLTAALMLGMLGTAPEALFRQVSAAEIPDQPAEETVPQSKPDDQGQFTLTLMPGQDQEPIIKKYRPGTEVNAAELPVPRQFGCEFTGWFLDKYMMEPCPDPFVVRQNQTLYAAYALNGSSFAAYQDDMDPDVEFVVYSTERITEETLEDYIIFDDVYNNNLTISLEELSAELDPVQPGRSYEPQPGDDADPRIRQDLLPPPERGEFRYRLYAEKGFGAGQLYGFTVVQPEKVRFLSAGNISLEENEATQLNFKIKQENVDIRRMNKNVAELPAEELVELKELEDNQFTGVFKSPRKVGEVIAVQVPGGGQQFFKILSEEGKNTYGMIYAASTEIWDEYAVNTSSQTMSDVTFDMAQEDVDATIREIETNIGVAAYIDSTLDSIRNNPEVMEFMAQVPQEDYDAFMELRAVDLGYGPLELRDMPTFDFSLDIPRAGTISGTIEDVDNGTAAFVKFVYTSPELTVNLGRAAGGPKGEIRLNFTISEEVTIKAAGVAYQKGTYPSQTEDYVQTHILPESVTTIKFDAVMELTDLPSFGDSEGKTEENGTDTNTEDPSGGTGDGTEDAENGTSSNTENADNDTTAGTEDRNDNTEDTTEDRNNTESGTEAASGSTEENTEDPDATADPNETADPDATADPNETADPNASTDPNETTDPSAVTDPSATTEPEDDPIEIETPWEVDPYEDKIQTQLNLAMANRDIYTYIEAMEAELVTNNEYYDMDFDYQTLFDQRLGSIQFTLDGYSSIQITLNFVVKIAAKAQFTGTFTYTFLSDIYTTNGMMIFDGNRLKDIQIFENGATWNGSRILRSNLNIELALKGGVGARAGLKLGVNFSGFQLNSLINIGIAADVGVYLELTGYICYRYNRATHSVYNNFANLWKKASEVNVEESSQLEGGIRISAGIYVDMSVTFTIITTFEATPVSFKFPLYQRELGAFDTSGKTKFYGDFLDLEETISLSDTDSQIRLGDLEAREAENKVRSCKTPERKPAEQGFENRSTGLAIYKGRLDTSTTDTGSKVTAYELPHYNDYTYEILSLSLDNGIIMDHRGFDGALRSTSFSFDNTEQISAYASIDANGNLTIKEGAPSLHMDIRVTARDVTSVFTQREPQKIFHIVYENAADSGSYQINFHDTDGNLLFSDQCPGSFKPLEFPGPGYVCQSPRYGTVSMGFTTEAPKLDQEIIDFCKKNMIPLPDPGKALTHEDTRRYVYLDMLSDMVEGDWKTTAETYWGYRAADYDLDSAHWVNKAGETVTAETVSTNGVTDLYLKMDLAYEPQAVWMVEYRNPDKPYYNLGNEVLKAVPYELGHLQEVAEMPDPDGSKFGAARASQQFGTWQYFSAWQDCRDKLPEEKQEVKLTYYAPYDEVIGERYYYNEAKSFRTVERLVPHRQVVMAKYLAYATYIWENVTFEKDGQKISVMTDIGKAPVIPAEFDTPDVVGWYNSLDGTVYSELPKLEQRAWPENWPAREPITYTAVTETRSVIFDPAGQGSLHAAEETGQWYALGDGGSWRYRSLDDGRMAIDYVPSDKQPDSSMHNPFPPALKVADPDFKIPVNTGAGTYYWQSQDLGGKVVTVPEFGTAVGLAELPWPESGVITMKPKFNTRTVIFKIEGTQEKFGGDTDIGFKYSGAVGQYMPAETVRYVLRGNYPGEAYYGNFDMADKITRIDMPKPYAFGSGDTAEGEKLVTTVYLKGGWEDTLTLDLAGGSLKDGTTGVLKQTGNSLDAVDLTAVQVNAFKRIPLEDDRYQLYSFAGWVNEAGETVTTAHYGDKLTARWADTGKIMFDLQMALSSPLTFGDGSGFKVIAFDCSKTLGQQEGYEIPADVTKPDGIYSFGTWHMTDPENTPVNGDTPASAFAGKPKKIVASFSFDAVDRFQLAGFAGTYDGKAHTVTVTQQEPGVTLLYAVGSGSFTAQAPSFKDAGTYNVRVKAMKDGAFTGDMKSATVQITPVSGVHVTVTGSTASVVYDGKAHTASGYTVTADNPLFTEADLTFRGNAAAKRTGAGKTVMGLKPEQFTASSNFTGVTVSVQDGWQEITRRPAAVTAQTVPANTPADQLTARVTGTLPGDQLRYTLSYGPAADDGSREILVTGDAVQGNYQVTFVNARTELDPAAVNRFTLEGYEGTYDGKAHSVTVSTDRPELSFRYAVGGGAYTEQQPVFTDAGTYTVHVKAYRGGADTGYFKTATVKILPVSGVTVMITGSTGTHVYDRQAHTAAGFAVAADNALFTEAAVIFTGNAAATRTDTGKTMMGLKPDQFAANANFTDVTFQVTDGWQEITRRPVTVKAMDALVGTPQEELTAEVTGALIGDKINYTISLGEAAPDGSRDILVTGDAIQGNYQVTFVNGRMKLDTVTVTFIAPEGHVLDVAPPQVEGSDYHEFVKQYTVEIPTGATISGSPALYTDPGHEPVWDDVFTCYVNGVPMHMTDLWDYPANVDCTITYQETVLFVDVSGGYYRYEYGVERSVTATASDPTATLEYSLDKINWSTVKPVFTETNDVLGQDSWGDPIYDEYITYVRATLPDGTQSLVYSASIEIVPKIIYVDIPGGFDAQKFYGEPDPVYSVTVNLYGKDETIQKSIPRIPGEDVGSYYSPDGAGIYSDRNYDVSFRNARNWVLTIVPRPVIVQADDKTKTTDQQDPELTYTVLNGDPALTVAANQVVKDNELEVTLTRDPGNIPGRYQIRVTARDLTGNYDVSTAGGILEITDPAAGN